MKINQRLEKFVKLALAAHNREHQASYDKATDELRAKALAKIAPQIKQRQALQAKQKQIAAQLQTLEWALTNQGYDFEGYSGRRKVVVTDLRKLGYTLPKRTCYSEDQILAQLLKATDAEGATLLAKIGVVL